MTRTAIALVLAVQAAILVVLFGLLYVAWSRLQRVRAGEATHVGWGVPAASIFLSAISAALAAAVWCS